MPYECGLFWCWKMEDFELELVERHWLHGRRCCFGLGLLGCLAVEVTGSSLGRRDLGFGVHEVVFCVGLRLLAEWLRPALHAVQEFYQGFVRPRPHLGLGSHSGGYSSRSSPELLPEASLPSMPTRLHSRLPLAEPQLSKARVLAT